MLDLVIMGDFVLPGELSRDTQVGVRDGIITHICQGREVLSAREVVDATGCVVFPGIVDAHVHTYSNPEEGIAPATRAAAAGGVTTFVEMPFDAYEPVFTPEVLARKIAVLEREAIADVAVLGSLSKEGRLDGIDRMVEMGVCGFKFSVIESDPHRFPRMNDAVLFEALPLITSHGLVTGFHAENGEIVNSLTARCRSLGNTYPKAHCESRPPVTETIEVLKLLELAHATKAAIHIHHVSHPRSIHLIDLFRQQHVDVTAETCPHYLLLCDDDMDRLGAFGKVNPPLRSRDACEELWHLLLSGHIDMVASDHAPWPLHKKRNEDIFTNASGSPSVQTLLPLVYQEAVLARGCSPVFLAKILAEAPARRFRLHPRKGHIGIGADADFAILDPTREWTIRVEDMYSAAGWTPFEGVRVRGKVIRTIRRGATIYLSDRGVTGKAGEGRFLPALRG
jgi:allantoinase